MLLRFEGDAWSSPRSGMRVRKQVRFLYWTRVASWCLELSMDSLRSQLSCATHADIRSSISHLAPNRFTELGTMAKRQRISQLAGVRNVSRSALVELAHMLMDMDAAELPSSRRDISRALDADVSQLTPYGHVLHTVD